jgi:integrase
MAIHTRKDGANIVYWRDPKTGKNRQKYFPRGLEGRSRAEAFNDSLGLRSYEKQQGTFRGPTFGELANSYLKAKFGEVAESTLKNQLIKFDKVIFPAIGNTPAADLNPLVMDRYTAARKRQGLKNTTIHRELTDIMAVLNWAVSRRYIGVNPLAGYKKPKRDDAVIQPLTQSEAQALYNEAAPHLRRFIALSYFAGIRPGAAELLPIPWTAVDFDRKTLFVESAKKNGLATRSIPLRDDLLEMLSQWQREDRKKALKKGWPMPDTIVNYRGGPVKTIKTAFQHAKKAANITRRLRPYDLRHAFATMILAGRGDLKATSELLGHTRTDTTTKIYQHVNPDMHRQVVEIMPSIDMSIQNVLTKKKVVTLRK